MGMEDTHCVFDGARTPRDKPQIINRRLGQDWNDFDAAMMHGIGLRGAFLWLAMWVLFPVVGWLVAIAPMGFGLVVFLSVNDPQAGFLYSNMSLGFGMGPANDSIITLFSR